MAYQDFWCGQGTDFSSTINLTNDDGSKINIAGYLFTGIVRKNFYSQNPSANLIVSITDAANGVANVTLDRANSANMENGSYRYTVLQIDATNKASILLEGFFYVTPSAMLMQPVNSSAIFPQVLPNTSNTSA